MDIPTYCSRKDPTLASPNPLVDTYMTLTGHTVDTYMTLTGHTVDTYQTHRPMIQYRPVSPLLSMLSSARYVIL